MRLLSRLRRFLGRLRRRVLGVFVELPPAEPVDDGLPRQVDKPGGHGGGIARYFGSAAYIDSQADSIGVPLVILAFFNRSGSNLLAAALRDSGAYRGFREQLNHGNVIKAAEDCGLENFEAYIRHISAPARAAGVPFGVKASPEQIGMLHHFGVLRLFARVDVLHIERDDVLGQAISYCIADDTKRWSSLHKAPPEAEPAYDGERIRAVMREAALAGLRVRLVCETLGLNRIPVSYEELAADSQATVRRLSTVLNVSLEGHTLQPPALRKQAGATNTLFRERFLSELYGSTEDRPLHGGPRPTRQVADASGERGPGST